MFVYYCEKAKYDRPIHWENSIRSYQNITINDKLETITDDTLKKFKEAIKNQFVESLIKNTSTAGLELSRFSSSKISTLLALKNQNLVFQNHIKTAIRTFANKLISELEIDPSLDEGSFRIKLYMNYFHKRNYLLESMSGQVSHWNGSFSLKKSAALEKKDFVLVMQQAMRQADQALKAELKGFFATRRG